MRDSLHKPKNGMPKCTYRWRKVSAGDGDVYVPWNVPIEVLGRTFEFRRLESGVEAIVLSNIEGERAGDGDQDGEGDGIDGTTSSSHVDLN